MSKNCEFLAAIGRCSRTPINDFSSVCLQLESDLVELSKLRLEHINGVRQSCRYLGEKFDCNLQFLELAALMHDMVRERPVKQQFEILQEAGFHVDEIMRKNPVLLHAKVASVLALKKYKLPIEVAEIVACHTTGKSEMNLEECVFFLADALEPGRAWSSWKRLEDVVEDLRENLLDCLRWKLDYTLKRGKMIHFHSLDCWNWLCDWKCAQ